MASKGMSTTLVIIVAAVVILVTALVILTIFGTSITPIGTIQELRNQCTLTNKQLCETSGVVSPSWDLRIYKVGNDILSCEDVCGPASDACIEHTWQNTC